MEKFAFPFASTPQTPRADINDFVKAIAESVEKKAIVDSMLEETCFFLRTALKVSFIAFAPKLQWKDFQGQPIEASKHDAWVEIVLLPRRLISEQLPRSLLLTQSAQFAAIERKKSWVRKDKKNNHTLVHAQGHVALGAIYAIQLAKRIDIESLFLHTHKLTITQIGQKNDEAHAEIEKLWMAEQQKYDEETDCGRNVGVQRIWNKNLKERLDGSDFLTPRRHRMILKVLRHRIQSPHYKSRKYQTAEKALVDRVISLGALREESEKMQREFILGFGVLLNELSHVAKQYEDAESGSAFYWSSVVMLHYLLGYEEVFPFWGEDQAVDHLTDWLRDISNTVKDLNLEEKIRSSIREVLWQVTKRRRIRDSDVYQIKTSVIARDLSNEITKSAATLGVSERDVLERVGSEFGLAVTDPTEVTPRSPRLTKDDEILLFAEDESPIVKYGGRTVTQLKRDYLDQLVRELYRTVDHVKPPELRGSIELEYDDPEMLGGQIRNLRKVLGLRQQDLRHYGISQSYLSELEKGRKGEHVYAPSENALYKVLTALKKSHSAKLNSTH